MTVISAQGNFMTKKNYLICMLAIAPFVQSCNVDFKKIEKKAATINHYESVALGLAKENRELHADIKRLEYEIVKLKEENNFYAQKLGIHPKEEHAEGGHGSHGNLAENNFHSAPSEHGGVEHGNTHSEVATHTENSHEAKVEHGRSIASVAPHGKAEDKIEKDYVEFKTYKWRAEDMMQIADKEFKEKHYEKASQFYYSIIQNYPHFKGVNDEFYFKAGIAAYESGAHHEWTISHFEALMKTYPTSQYYRSAKLWVALTHLKLGDKKKFFTTVEEFRKKYRNTNEWKILSSYYEKIEEKTNE